MENGFSGYYAYVNRNKKGMTLNLKTEEGKQIFTELLKTADVVCENYKVGVLERLGFPYEKMKEINPRIIYGSISGFGLTAERMFTFRVVWMADDGTWHTNVGYRCQFNGAIGPYKGGLRFQANVYPAAGTAMIASASLGMALYFRPPMKSTRESATDSFSV